MSVAFDYDLIELEEGFKIDSLDKAIWAMRQIKKHTDEQQEIKNAAQSQINRISAWCDEEVQKLQNKIDWLVPYLEQYHRTILEADPKKKTIKLVDGTLKLHKLQPKFERDNDALVVWLEKRKDKLKDLIKVEKTPRWDELKKLCEVVDDHIVYPVTGETVDGVTVVKPDEEYKFDIKVG